MSYLRKIRKHFPCTGSSYSIRKVTHDSLVEYLNLQHVSLCRFSVFSGISEAFVSNFRQKLESMFSGY